MITNFLMDNSALVPIALALLVVVCLTLGYWLRRNSRALWALAGLSMLPVVALTLVPTAGRAYEFCAVQFAMPTWGTVELLANVALFFPPVFFAALATRRPLPMLAAGTATSAAIELIQALIPAIGRACDTNDWAMNTTGALTATLTAQATLALAGRATRKGHAGAGDHGRGSGGEARRAGCGGCTPTRNGE